MHPHNQRIVASLVWGVLVTLSIVRAGRAQALPVAAPAKTVATNAVDEMRQALRVGVRDPLNADELAFRKSNLEKHAQELRSLNDQRQALGLQEWRDEDRDASIRDIDRPIREALAQRLAKGLREVLQPGGDQTLQLAVTTLIGEMGTTVRGIGTRAGFARELSPELIQLVKGKDSAISASAARALGKIFPPPDEAAAALGSLFQTGAAAQRRAAAEALDSMVRTAAQLARGRSTTGVEANLQELVVTSTAVVRAAGPGMGDADPRTRRFSLQAVREAAVALADLIADPRSRQEFPPEGRKLSVDEQKDIEAYKAQVQEEQQNLLPLLRALRDATPAASHALNDALPAVCVSACQALEALAGSRLRVRYKVASVPGSTGKETDELLPPLRKSVPGLALLLAHKQVEVRLAALYVLESLEGVAAPAADTLVNALQDADPYVRMGAARALGRMAPQGGDKATVALGKLLEDDNGDVRITTVTVLGRYGPAGKAAVPALGRVIRGGEAAMRLEAIRAVVAVGAEAQPAIPALISALSFADVAVRSAAARALGTFGPAAKDAVKPLRLALDDADATVRLAAGEALVNIVGPIKDKRP